MIQKSKLFNDDELNKDRFSLSNKDNADNFAKLKDDEDVYYCQFDNKFAFHSGEECHHPYEQYRESGACKYTDCRECDYQNVCDEWVE